MWRVSCSCPVEACCWRSLICSAPIPPAQITPFRVMLSSVPSIPHARKARLLCNPGLLSTNIDVCYGRKCCELRERSIFSFNLDTNNSTDNFEKKRSRPIAFGSFWDNRSRVSSAPLIGTTSSLSWALDNYSSLTTWVSVTSSTGISSQWGTGRRLDSRSGYLMLLWFSF